MWLTLHRSLLKTPGKLWTGCTGPAKRRETSCKKALSWHRKTYRSLAEDVKDEVCKLTSLVAAAASSVTGAPVYQQEPGTLQTTYAQALNSRLPTMHLSMLARTRIKGRQILVDKDPSADMSHLQELTEHVLVAKANEVLSMMKTKLTDSPGAPWAVRAKKLHNGGVVFELGDDATAQWVRKEKATFTSAFGSTSVVRMWSILFIVKYVPVSHSPDAMSEHRRIERDSGLTKDSLLATRWIKPMQRR